MSRLSKKRNALVLDNVGSDMVQGSRPMKKHKSAALKVGSDFSGLDTLVIASKKLCAKIEKPVVSTHACDKSRACKKLIMHLHAPAVFNNDIRTRDTSSLPDCDIYSFTSPCHPFSCGGKMGGITTADGQLLFKILDFIKLKQPKAIISENVPTFEFKFRPVRDALITDLEKLGYVVQSGLLKTSDLGIPQHRTRWYMIAIHKKVLRRNDIPFGKHWLPTKIAGSGSLSDIDVKPLPDGLWKMMPDHPLHRTNVLSALEKSSASVNPFQTPVVIDMGSSIRYSSFKIDACMTLTSNRCSMFGYWITTKGGPMDVYDMMHLQGFSQKDFGDFNALGVSNTAMAACLGNAQSLNVLMKVVPRALYLARLITKSEFEVMDRSGCRWELPSWILHIGSWSSGKDFVQLRPC